MTLHSSSKAAALAGVSIRQLDYWTRTKAITPTVEANGSGTRRRWSDEDVAALTAMGQAAEAIDVSRHHDIVRAVGEAARQRSMIVVPLGSGVTLWIDTRWCRPVEVSA